MASPSYRNDGPTTQQAGSINYVSDVGNVAQGRQHSPRPRPNLSEVIQQFTPLVDRLCVVKARLTSFREHLIGAQPENTKAEINPTPQTHMDQLHLVQQDLQSILSTIEDEIQALDTVL